MSQYLLLDVNLLNLNCSVKRTANRADHSQEPRSDEPDLGLHVLLRPVSLNTMSKDGNQNNKQTFVISYCREKMTVNTSSVKYLRGLWFMILRTDQIRP